MNVSQVVFIILGLVTLAGAAGVVLNRKLFHSALYLVLSFVGVAGLYILLEAEFLAMIQLLVYVGAISVLIIFAVMLSRNMMSADYKARNSDWGLGVFVAGGLLAALVIILLRVKWPVADSTVSAGTIGALGEALTNPTKFALPFEVASILLLVALVGAVIIAREK